MTGVWDGHICNYPEGNRYCSGFHYLLSERIRKREYDHLEEELSNQGKHLNDIEYLPPCFWSVNLFGKQSIRVEHDNPAAPNLNLIKEDLPQSSIFSWPFAISFTPGALEKESEGSYPANLESIRLPYFNSKIKPTQSGHSGTVDHCVSKKNSGSSVTL